MSILNFENRTPRSLEAMYEYITDREKTDPYATFGIGVNPRYAVREMQFVQDLYFRDYIVHPYIQVIFCFDVGVSFSTPMLREICMEIGYCLVLDDRQIVGAVHYKDTEKKHCHYLINYVGIRGNLYRQEHSIIFYKQRVNQVLLKYELNPIEYYGRTFQENVV